MVDVKNGQPAATTEPVNLAGRWRLRAFADVSSALGSAFENRGLRSDRVVVAMHFASTEKSASGQQGRTGVDDVESKWKPKTNPPAQRDALVEKVSWVSTLQLPAAWFLHLRIRTDVLGFGSVFVTVVYVSIALERPAIVAADGIVANVFYDRCCVHGDLLLSAATGLPPGVVAH